MKSLSELTNERHLIETCAATLEWDQETMMPEQGVTYRAEQLGWLSAQAHHLQTSQQWSDALAAAIENCDQADQIQWLNLKEMQRRADLARRLPNALVQEFTQTSALAKQAWAHAREHSDFSSFAPSLQQLIDLSRQKADCLGFENEPYDALLNEHERGSNSEKIAELFAGLRSELCDIAHEATARSAKRRTPLPDGPYPQARQEELNQRIAESIGFSFAAGRIDRTAHPFCTTLGPRDVRLTTRYDEQDFTSSLFGVLHEAGHGLYEQNLPSHSLGTPACEAVSLGIHESQSRLWENHVGRSECFWQQWFPVACDLFPQLRTLRFQEFMSHIHRASYSLIRVEADEATYDLHVMLRFEIERQLFRGDMRVDQIPSVWNELVQKSFGLSVPNDAAGCLQDIHWSMGGFGYFPTYTLGNIRAAQLFNRAVQQPMIAKDCQRADYLSLLEWLTQNIYRHGALHDPDALMLMATGQPSVSCDHLQHLRQRYLTD